MIKTGKVYKIYYLNIINEKRKVFSFTGLCVSYSKNHGSFILRNIFNKEMVELLFLENSPFIIKIEDLKMFNFKFKKSKLFFKKLFWIKEVVQKKIIKKFIPYKPINFNSYILPNNYKKVQFREIRDKYRIKF